MPSGKRNRLITIEQVADSVDSSGFPVETWTPLAVVWAALTPESGQERYAGNQLTAPFETRWDVPYKADWDPELVDVCKVRRLVYEGRAYDIRHAERTGMKREDVVFVTLARQG